MRRAARLLLAAVLVTGAAGAAPASAAPDGTAGSAATATGTPLMVVVDVSGSMADHDRNGTIKIEGAKAGLLELLNGLPPDSRIGLRSYPEAGGSCGDGHLDIPVAERDPGTMGATVRALRADGDTPTAEALRAAGADLKAAGYASATILLISDGQSTCDPPCPVAAELAAQGLDVTVRGMGFDIDQAGADEMRCLADATGGSYTDVADAADLATELSSAATAALQVTTSAPLRYNPSTQTSLPVSAVITNTAAVAAGDVRATLTFDPTASRGALVTTPALVLGNAAAGGTLRATWTAYPDRGVTSGSLAYTVVVTSRGSPPVVTTGSVRVVDRLTVEDAGPLLRDAEHVVVLGDSYSSGEGAGDYDDAGGKCHRSPHTYAYALWPADQVTNLACSGAVSGDHLGHQVDRGSLLHPWPSQRQQLDALDQAPDLVLLTMGGNDVNFSSIIRNCLFELGCNGLVRGGTCLSTDLVTSAADLLPWCADGAANAAFSDPLLWSAQLAGLRTTLVEYYRQVLYDVGAPVVVLPYVEVVPNTARGALACVRPLPGVGTHEFDLIRWLQAELNNQIAAAVQEVRGQGYGSRLFFAEDVATALQPDHTLCSDSGRRWMRPVISGLDSQEYVHPTAEGYRAIAAALVRWSGHMSPPSVVPSQPKPPGWIQRAGSAVVDGVENVGSWIGDRAGDVRDFVLSQPGSRIFTNPLRIHAGGFGPGQSVVLGAGSTLQTLGVTTADEHGDVEAVVELPPGLHPGDHVLFAAGFADGGRYRLQWATTEVAGPGVAGSLGFTGVFLVVLAAGWLLLRQGRRRPR